MNKIGQDLLRSSKKNIYIKKKDIYKKYIFKSSNLSDSLPEQCGEAVTDRYPILCQICQKFSYCQKLVATEIKVIKSVFYRVRPRDQKAGQTAIQDHTSNCIKFRYFHIKCSTACHRLPWSRRKRKK